MTFGCMKGQPEPNSGQGEPALEREIPDGITKGRLKGTVGIYVYDPGPAEEATFRIPITDRYREGVSDNPGTAAQIRVRLFLLCLA